MKKWLKHGLITAIIFFLFFTSLWIYDSIDHNCLLDPGRMLPVGCCEDCFDFTSLAFFAIPTLLGFLIGVIISWMSRLFGGEKVTQVTRAKR
jgi:predicted permease